MANSVRLESGWLFRQLESAEQRANNLPFWLSKPSAPSRPSPSSGDDIKPKNEGCDERTE
jgi:hypothetical protein